MKNVFTYAIKYLQVAAMVSLTAVIGFLMGEKSLIQKHKLEEKKSILENENKALSQEIKIIERKLTLMRSDPLAFEKEAKRKLGMARPDETVYLFEPKSSSRGKEGSLEATLEKEAKSP